MPDWFGDTPVEMRELSPSHFTGWKQFCDGYGCSNESAVMSGGKFFCLDCAEDDFNDNLEG